MREHPAVLGEKPFHVAMPFVQLGDDEDGIVLRLLAEHRLPDRGTDGLEEGFGADAGVGGELPAVVRFAADLGDCASVPSKGTRYSTDTAPKS